MHIAEHARWRLRAPAPRESRSRNGPAGNTWPLPMPKSGSTATMHRSFAKRRILKAVVHDDRVRARLRGRKRAGVAVARDPGRAVARVQQRLIADFARVHIRRHAQRPDRAPAIAARQRVRVRPKLGADGARDRRFARAADGEVADADDRHRRMARDRRAKAMRRRPPRTPTTPASAARAASSAASRPCASALQNSGGRIGALSARGQGPCAASCSDRVVERLGALRSRRRAPLRSAACARASSRQSRATAAGKLAASSRLRGAARGEQRVEHILEALDVGPGDDRRAELRRLDRIVALEMRQQAARHQAHRREIVEACPSSPSVSAT